MSFPRPGCLQIYIIWHRGFEESVAGPAGQGGVREPSGLQSPHENQVGPHKNQVAAQIQRQKPKWLLQRPAAGRSHGCWRWLGKLTKPWGRDMPLWRQAILIGQAKRLTSMSADEHSAWGRSMLAKRGGYAVHRAYRLQGRNPTAAANESRRQRVQSQKQAEERWDMNRRIQALVNSWRWKKS